MKKSEETSQIDWHSGFAGGLNLSLKDYLQDIEISREVQLTKVPIRMDCLILKKKDDVLIDNDLGRGFRGHNIIEYKNPDDELNIDVVWKTIGYAGIYKSSGRYVNEIPAEELTISIVRTRKPVKLISDVEKSCGKVIREQDGVYRIEGIISVPLRIVVLNEVSDPKLLALKVMKKNADENDIREFIKETAKYSAPGDKQDADAVIQVCAKANTDVFEKMKGDETMCEALREIMADVIADDLKAAENNGELKTLYSLVHDGLLDINEAAKRANMTLEAFKEGLSAAYSK